MNRDYGRNHVLWLALALSLAACGQTATPGQESAANPGAVPPDTSKIPHAATTPVGGGMAVPQHIGVSNPTGLGLIIRAHLGQQDIPLGSIEPKRHAAFVLQAPPGALIQLSARDSAGAHLYQATLFAADSSLSWVIH